MTLMRLMDRNEARSSMDEVVRHVGSGLSSFEAALQLVEKIEFREGYKALGYRSMALCLEAELKVSRQRANQLMNRMQQTRLLSAAVGEDIVLTDTNARMFRQHPEYVDEVLDLMEHGHTPAEAVERLSWSVSQVRLPGVVFRCKQCGEVGLVDTKFEVVDATL